MWQSQNEDCTATIQVLKWSPKHGHDILPDRAMKELDEVVAKNVGKNWVLEISAIPLLSSNAIAQLIGVVRRVSLENGRIALANPPPTVATVLRMTRLTKMLPMFETIALARASFV